MGNCVPGLNVSDKGQKKKIGGMLLYPILGITKPTGVMQSAAWAQRQAVGAHTDYQI